MKPATKKQKGDLAELKVACDLRRRGYIVSIPFGEEAPYDLVIDRGEALERVQVKYVDRGSRCVAEVPCHSQTIVNGKVRKVTPYTAKTIDWLAVYDLQTDRCFYIPAAELGNGRTAFSLRFAPARNGQRTGIRFAESYSDLEPRELRLMGG